MSKVGVAIVFPFIGYKKVAGSITARLLPVKCCLGEDDKSRRKRNNRDIPLYMCQKRGISRTS
ncbi:hypothetical protein WM46_22895 [Citrobacter freundii complex sp. CFNIH2]|nr:hypothetical protein WM46_22895 [Citrobacter freundii complex sp. CFNIH2]AVI00569.1 hypothetical protein AL479_22920 [Citrobacter amalonaticus]